MAALCLQSPLQKPLSGGWEQMPTRSLRWRRAGDGLLVLCGIAGCTSFLMSTSVLRTLFVTAFPAVFLLVGYGAWAVLEINSEATVRRGLKVLLLGLAWFWTAVGLVELIAWSAWALLVVPAAAIGVGVVAWRRSRRRSRALWDVAEVIALSADHPASTVSGSSVEDLCRLWRLTGQEVREAGAQPSKVLWLAEVRQLILDELADRDPQGMARWLADRPEKTDPLPYLTRQIR